MKAERSKSTPGMPAVRSTSSQEVPMARSGDVQLIGHATGPVEITARERPAADPSDTVSGPTAASDTQSGEKPASDTNSDDEEKSSTDPGAESDPGSTVTETGELRVITTLKGLTTSAALIIDGQKQGTTPNSLQVAAGKHVVRVERQGYKAIEKTAQVKAN